jgi:hypothetical protein
MEQNTQPDKDDPRVSRGRRLIFLLRPSQGESKEAFKTRLWAAFEQNSSSDQSAADGSN